MPPKKTMKRRRKYGRRRKKYNVMSVPSGVRPAERLGKFRFVQAIILETDASGALSWTRFKANGCVDPAADLTGTHHPRGWLDQSSNFSKYIVTGSKITIRCQPYQGTGMIGVYTSAQALPYTHATSIMEAKRGTYAVTTTTEGGMPRRLSAKFSCRKLFGIKDPLDKVGDLGAETSADPTNTAYYYVYIEGATAVLTKSFMIATIEYNVLFLDPKNTNIDGWS